MNPIFTQERINYLKRKILSEIAKIFDPSGSLDPIILIAKIIMQVGWKSKIDWNETVPSALHYNMVKICAANHTLEWSEDQQTFTNR